jgi:hypothetical protein
MNEEILTKKRINLENEFYIMDLAYGKCAEYFEKKEENIHKLLNIYESVENGIIACKNMIQNGPRVTIPECKERLFDLEVNMLKIIFVFKSKNKNWEPELWNDFLGNEIKQNKRHYNILARKAGICIHKSNELYNLLVNS